MKEGDRAEQSVDASTPRTRQCIRFHSRVRCLARRHGGQLAQGSCFLSICAVFSLSVPLGVGLLSQRCQTRARTSSTHASSAGVDVGLTRWEMLGILTCWSLLRPQHLPCTATDTSRRASTQPSAQPQTCHTHTSTKRTSILVVTERESTRVSLGRK
eukprot:2426000-Rhodomonas_salina.1